MLRVRLQVRITPDHVHSILYARMAISLPVALTAILTTSLPWCVTQLEKIGLTRKRACVRWQTRQRAKLLTMRKVSSILTLHQARGDRSSIGRALDCGSSGCGFKPHRSPSISHFISPVVIFPIAMQLWQGYNSPWELCWLFVALVAVVTQVAGALLYQKWRQLGFFQVQVWSKGVYAEALSLHYLWKRTLGYTAI